MFNYIRLEGQDPITAQYQTYTVLTDTLILELILLSKHK